MILETLCKFIPSRVRIKTLYWVQKEIEIDKDLTKLFELIDNDQFSGAFKLLEELQLKWIGIKPNPPDWFHKDYIGQLTKTIDLRLFSPYICKKSIK